MDQLPLASLLDIALEAARAAAIEIMAVYEGEIAVSAKRDASPVTLADGRAEEIILPRLKAAVPGIPVISEEQAEDEGLPAEAPRLFWLVDPLDGTKEFIKRNGEFTVNIALIRDGRAVLGVVGLPARNRLYAAAGPGTAMRIDGTDAPVKIETRAAPAKGLTAAVSRSHDSMDALNPVLETHKVVNKVVAGSALKFCLVAEGSADLYPRLGPTMEWDTAAGQAVLEAAGGRVTDPDGKPFSYGKPGFRNGGFLALGR